jgi:hypothetical protein
MGGKDVHAIQDVYFIPRSGFRVTPLASQFSGVHPDLVVGAILGSSVHALSMSARLSTSSNIYFAMLFLSIA